MKTELIVRDGSAILHLTAETKYEKTQIALVNNCFDKREVSITVEEYTYGDFSNAKSAEVNVFFSVAPPKPIDDPQMSCGCPRSNRSICPHGNSDLA